MPVEILTPREVPLGGPRAMTVRRTLPQKQRTLIGAWCFADHYGPDDVSHSGGMDVPPHPHTGLQTVSWLFSGEIEHRDSIGTQSIVRPGELNLMTAGRGISHSEVSTADTHVLHGMQLWVALPGTARFTTPNFEHYTPDPVTLDGGLARVFLGTSMGNTSPVETFTPLLGAELTVDAGATLTLDVDVTFEHGFIVDEGAVELDGTTLQRAELGYVAPGQTQVRLRNTGHEPTRLLVLGGPPFGEQVIMWWNFMGRTHEDIEAYRAAWEAQSEQFGTVTGYRSDTGYHSDTGYRSENAARWRLPAPELPHSRLTPRG